MTDAPSYTPIYFDDGHVQCWVIAKLIHKEGEDPFYLIPDGAEMYPSKETTETAIESKKAWYLSEAAEKQQND